MVRYIKSRFEVSRNGHQIRCLRLLTGAHFARRFDRSHLDAEHMAGAELFVVGLRIQPAALDEDLGQPFRFADHQHVAGVYLEECLNSAKRVNVLALHLWSRVRDPAESKSTCG